MATQEQIKLNQKRVSEQWDNTLKKKARMYDKGEQDHRDTKSIFKFIGMFGIFVLVASILFGGTPDLVDGFTNYLMTCR
jgi:hypothetical protein